MTETNHHIKLETNGKYCGVRCKTEPGPYGRECSQFKGSPPLEEEENNYIRCQACLDSEVKEDEAVKLFYNKILEDMIITGNGIVRIDPFDVFVNDKDYDGAEL